MKISTRELTGMALNYTVAKCEEFKQHAAASLVIMGDYSPSTNWSQGGPIIEKEEIGIGIGIAKYNNTNNMWKAGKSQWLLFGPSPLIAAMRCYVYSKMGVEVEVPDELLSP